MAILDKNLYPPILDTYMPAFVRTDNCRIYFSLSSYNNAAEIKYAQLILSYQSTNFSALDPTKYPAGIKVTTVFPSDDESRPDQYYIELTPEDVVNGRVELNQFYKIQIRFVGTAATDFDITGTTNANAANQSTIAAWLSYNLDHFSEWSTVCLVRGILQPHIELLGWEEAALEGIESVFSGQVADFVGSMYFNEEETLVESETLYSYRIRVYEEGGNGEPYYDSGIRYTETYNPMEINYSFQYGFQSAVRYTATIDITTENGYELTKEYSFRTIDGGTVILDADIYSVANEEQGTIDISIKNKTDDPFVGSVTIRRTSSETNFEKWEDVHTFTLTEQQPISYEWSDLGIESGTWYRYCAQKRDGKGARGIVVLTEGPVMTEMHHASLYSQGLQFKVKYNPGVSAYKHNVADNKTDTIGGKYPFIRRNGAMNYRSFSLTGLITQYCDEDELYIKKDDIYGEARTLYEQFNTDNNIGPLYDQIYEKRFRDIIIDFLYDDSVKLFRSNTEGNMLVRLMDISFTPNQTLGRMIYTFTANAIEVAECTTENLDKYDIQPFGSYSTQSVSSYYMLAQHYGGYQTDEEVLNLIQGLHGMETIESFVDTVTYLKSVKITFNGEPQVWRTDAAGALYEVTDSLDATDVFRGYAVLINGVPMLVGRNGIIEFTDEDVYITSIVFPAQGGTDAVIDYVARIDSTEDLSLLASTSQYTAVCGQKSDITTYGESMSEELFAKYYLDYEDYYQLLISIDKMSIEADYGTVVYVKDAFDSTEHRHVIGPTGVLDFKEEDGGITDFYFGGINLSLTNDPNRLSPRLFEFSERGSAETVESIENPVPNGVYIIENPPEVLPRTAAAEKLVNETNRMIYYKGQWYFFSDTNDVLCSAEVLVNYQILIVKGIY